MKKKKGEKEFRYRASPLESRYPNKYEDNDNDDACCARNRLELIQFPFLFPCSPFPTFLAVFCPLPPPPSPLLLSLNRSIQRFLFCPSFYIKLSLSFSLFILPLVIPLSSRASHTCRERFLFTAESLASRLLNLLKKIRIKNLKI